jgi:hypothetical protein
MATKNEKKSRKQMKRLENLEEQELDDVLASGIVVGEMRS